MSAFTLSYMLNTSQPICWPKGSVFGMFHRKLVAIVDVVPVISYRDPVVGTVSDVVV